MHGAESLSHSALIPQRAVTCVANCMSSLIVKWMGKQRGEGFTCHSCVQRTRTHDTAAAQGDGEVDVLDEKRVLWVLITACLLLRSFRVIRSILTRGARIEQTDSFESQSLTSSAFYSCQIHSLLGEELLVMNLLDVRERRLNST